jgi:hypothetical protein
MAYDESFAPEPEVQAAPPVVESAAVVETPVETPVETAAVEATIPEAAAATTAETETTTAAESTTEAAAETAAETAEVVVTPTFDEAAFLKAQFGDDAPATAAELKQRFDALQAKQLTPEQEAQLNLLKDPAKLGEFAKLATQDYNKLDAATVMRQAFAQKNPGMSDALVERLFTKQFTERFPTLAAALANPDDFEPTDPALLAEKEEADYYANADRAALTEAQTKKVQEYVSSQAAATQPQLTAEQAADVAALPKWLDEAYKEGSTLPVDLGDGTKLALPIQNAADFKAAFNNTYALLDNATLTKPITEGGTLDRQKHALVTAFLQNPTAFMQNIAKGVRASMPKPAPSIPIAVVTNSSAAKATPAAAATSTGVSAESNQPAGINADDWMKNL